MLAALVFDFDGLIADTESVEFKTWSAEFQHHGVELALEEWIKCVGGGPGIWDVFDHLQELVGTPLERRDVMARRHGRFVELRHTIGVLPGVESLLDEAQSMNVPCGVASSSRSDWVCGFLDEFGLTDRFETIVTRDHVASPKPAPDLYLEACKRLGAPPPEALALEDSTNGVTAAKDAGMKCIAVPNTITRTFDFSRADARIETLAGASIKSLLELTTANC